MTDLSCVFAAGVEEFLGQFLEPIAVFDFSGVCRYRSKQFIKTLQETNTAADKFETIADPASPFFGYWQAAIVQGYSEFIEPQLFCEIRLDTSTQTVVLKIQKCPLRLIVESLNYAAAVINNQQSVVCCNQQFLDLLGLEMSSPPVELNQLIVLEDARVDCLLWNDLVAGRISEYEIEKRFYRGQELIWTNFHAKAVSPEDIPSSESFYTIVLEDISDTRATYEALVLDHEKWNIFLANRLNLFFQTDLDGRIYSISGAVAATLGYPSNVLIGMAISELVHPRDLPNFRNFLRFWSQPDTTSIMVECAFLKYRTQEEVYLYIHGQCLSTQNQNAGIIIYAVDITERKQLEQELQIKEERYRSLVSNLPGAVYRSSGDFSNYYGFEVISLGIEEVTGYSLGEFIQSPGLYRSLIVESDHEMIQQTIQQAQSQQNSFTLQYQIRSASGQLRWIEDRARCVVDSTGRLQWIDGVLFDITQQKQSEDLLQAIFDQAAVGINLTDLAGRIVRVNRKQCEMLGYEEAELVGMSASALTLASERAFEREIVQALLDGAMESYSTDKQDICKNGEPLWVTVTMSVIRDRNTPRYLVTIVQDITQRKQIEAEKATAQRALASSEAQFRLLFERATIGVSITNPLGYIVKCNSALQDFLGYSEAQLQQIRFDQYTYHDDINSDVEQFAALTSGQISQYQMEKRFIRADGTVVWGNLRIASQSVANGEMLIFAFIEDITERKQQEEELRNQEAQFRAIFETAPMGIALPSPEGQYIKMNAEYERITGYGLAELSSGVTFLDIVHPDERIEDATQYNRIVEGEIDVYQMEKRYIRPDGSLLWAHLTAAVVRDADGQLRFSYGLIQDIDEIKRVQQDSKRFMQLLQTTLELATDGILIIDMQANLLYYNQQIIRLWGISEAIMKQHNDDLLVLSMKDGLLKPDEFEAQIKREYVNPELEDRQHWQLTNGKTYLRISRPQMINGQVVGRVIFWRGT
jgi:PAS domain S-box-containing protein